MKPVSHAQLSKAIFVPGFGELKGRTLSKTFYKDIKILTDSEGLLCTINKINFLIPWGMVECMVLED